MSYYADLAAALRARKLTEGQVLDVLRTVREASENSGDAPEAEFGPAARYAENFSGERQVTSTQFVRAGALLGSIAAFVLLRVVVFPETDFLPWGTVQGVATFVIIGLLGDLVARGLNRRIPRGF
ncbi:hypothetical protein [Microbacterium lacticum]